MVRFYHLGESNSVPEFLYWAMLLDWMISKELPNASLCDSVAISSHFNLVSGNSCGCEDSYLTRTHCKKVLCVLIRPHLSHKCRSKCLTLFLHSCMLILIVLAGNLIQFTFWILDANPTKLTLHESHQSEPVSALSN